MTVRVVLKQDTQYNYDKDAIPDDARLQRHVDSIWEMMVAEHPELLAPKVDKDMKVINIDAGPNSAWIQSLPSNASEIAIHEHLADKNRPS